MKYLLPTKTLANAQARCLRCGKPFVQRRTKRKYCSDYCRNGASRISLVDKTAFEYLSKAWRV